VVTIRENIEGPYGPFLHFNHLWKQKCPLYLRLEKHGMKDVNVIGDLVVDALKDNHYQIDGLDKSDTLVKFRITFKTRGGNVRHLIRLYADKAEFEDLYHFDNNPLAGGHNTLPLEFMPIYNTVLSVYVKQTGSIPETDFILF